MEIAFFIASFLFGTTTYFPSVLSNVTLTIVGSLGYKYNTGFAYPPSHSNGNFSNLLEEM